MADRTKGSKDEEEEQNALLELIEAAGMDDEDGEDDGLDIVSLKLAVLTTVAPSFRKGASIEEIIGTCNTVIDWVLADVLADE